MDIALSDVIQFLILFGILYFGGIIHELGHALVALKCGDDTARLMGRITLHPASHFDPIMTLFMPTIFLEKSI